MHVIAQNENNTDTFSDNFDTYVINFDITGPSFTQQSPADDTFIYAKRPDFSWSASDAYTGVQKFQLYVDGELKADNLTNNYFTISNNLSCGTHSWFVTGIDNLDNVADSSTVLFDIICGGGSGTLIIVPNLVASTTNQSTNQNHSQPVKTETDIQQITPIKSVNDNQTILTAPKPQETIETDAPKLTVISISQPLSLGLQNREVLKLQEQLKQMGFFPQEVSVTGYFGSITKQAVIKFQESIGIYPCGIIGAKTRMALAGKEFRTNPDYLFTKELKYADEGDEVKQLQIRLQDQNFFPYYVGSTSWYGPITQTAVKLFQKFYGLVQNGMIDKLTREILNR